jgi:hypothetical protein
MYNDIGIRQSFWGFLQDKDDSTSLFTLGIEILERRSSEPHNEVNIGLVYRMNKQNGRLKADGENPNYWFITARKGFVLNDGRYKIVIDNNQL